MNVRRRIAAARANSLYNIDQQFGSIEFTVSHLGLFTSHGRFERFRAMLSLDPEHPERTRILVHVDAPSVNLPWRDGADMLRAAEFFDVQHYPEVTFRSTEIGPSSADRYSIAGLLEIRGVTRPLVLDAKLVGRHPGPQGAEIADFVATGS